jgi:NAD(P)-dependent dehydrogenase (short-subunit alcohol dehydrogenase family)
MPARLPSGQDGAVAANRVVLVAGGAGAVGEGIVSALLAGGAEVVVPSRDPARLAELASRLGSPPGLRTLVGDVGTPAGAAQVRDAVLAAAGRPDAVVASVGGWRQGGPLVETPLADVRAVLDTGLLAHVVCAQVFLPVLPRGGSYLTINGGAAEEPVAGAGPVSISAAGQLMLTRVLALESAERGVRVNGLVLGVVATRARQAPRPEWITPEEVGAFVAALVGDAGAGVSGSVIRLLTRPPR